MNNKLGSSVIYLTEEQYCQVKISKFFDIQHLRLVVTWHTGSIFVQVQIPWFKNHEVDYLELCKLWSLSAFRVVSEKKRLCHGKESKDRYDTDRHVRKSQHMVRFVVQVIYVCCHATNS
jgi:hypothetical protein